MFLALGSYNGTDPAFSISGDSQAVQNWMGPAGAWFSDIAYLLFGGPAYLFPVLMLLGGLFAFRGDNSRSYDGYAAVLWRGGGAIMMLATSCGLATLHFVAPALRETAGGIVGQIVGAGMEQVLGYLGATVLLLVMWLVSVSLATGVSWLAVMDRTGRAVLATIGLVEMAIGRIQIWLEGRKAKQHRQELVIKSLSLIHI